MKKPDVYAAFAASMKQPARLVPVATAPVRAPSYAMDRYMQMKAFEFFTNSSQPPAGPPAAPFDASASFAEQMVAGKHLT
jgi:hypothetical protein